MNAPSSDGNLQVGDRVVVVRVTLPQWHYYIGTCGVVIHTFSNGDSTVRLDLDGKEHIAAPGYVRKIQPPREDLKVVRWDQCPWQPERIHG